MIALNIDCRNNGTNKRSSVKMDILMIDHSQSAKDKYPYFKSQFYVEDPSHRNPVLILRNGLIKPGVRLRIDGTEDVWMF